MRHSGHIRQRSPGSYELRYSLGTDPATVSGKWLPRPFEAPERTQKKN